MRASNLHIIIVGALWSSRGTHTVGSAIHDSVFRSLANTKLTLLTRYGTTEQLIHSVILLCSFQMLRIWLCSIVICVASQLGRVSPIAPNRTRNTAQFNANNTCPKRKIRNRPENGTQTRLEQNWALSTHVPGVDQAVNGP